MLILTMQMFCFSFSRVDSMTINGWEMMIPLAFFAGTGYARTITVLFVLIYWEVNFTQSSGC
jgi:hypothetical protein